MHPLDLGIAIIAVRLSLLYKVIHYYTLSRRVLVLPSIYTSFQNIAKSQMQKWRQKKNQQSNKRSLYTL